MISTHPDRPSRSRPPPARLLSAFLAVATLCSTGAVGAQTQTRRLTDADVERMIPALHAMIADYGVKVEEVQGLIARGQAVEDLQSWIMGGGITDPLAWIRENVRTDLPVIPGVRYHLECSREATKGYVQPTALFTYGLEAGEEGQAWIEGQGEEYLAGQILDHPALAGLRALELMAAGNFDSIMPAVGRMGEEKRTASQIRDQKIFGEFRSFYVARGFEKGNDVALGVVYRSADGRLTAWNKFYRDIDIKKVPACASMATGPYLGISGLPHEFRAPEGSAAGPDPFKTTLARTGVSKEDYDGLYSTIMMARYEASNPSLLNPIILPEDSPERRRQIAQEIAVRKQNVEVYRRHAAALDPLIAKIMALH